MSDNTNAITSAADFRFELAETLLDGIPRWVRSYRLSFPLHGLRISRYRGECASPLHLRDRNHTCTKLIPIFRCMKTVSPEHTEGTEGI